MSQGASKKLAALDLLIRDSRFKEAQEILQSLRRTNFSAKELLEFASLCRRAGLPGLPLSKLRPFVRPGGRKIGVTNPAFIIEYAACLVRLGATREAETLLNSLETQGDPEILKVRSHLHLGEWNYHLAIPLLREYIAFIPEGDYQRTINKLNLSMSLIFEGEYNVAAQLLNEIIANKENFQYRILKGNCYRILGGLEVYRENYEFAIQCLQKALTSFGDPSGLDSFLVRKWLAITQYFMEKGSPVSKLLLDSLTQEAILRKKWESVRDIDFHKACFHKDEQLLTKIYFGTSYPRFKERLKKRFPDLKLPETYLWRVGPSNNKKPLVFDLNECELKPAQAQYRMVASLISDFYRSFNTVDLFQGCYPGEFYSHGSSEQRVYQLSSRLRQVFEAEELPFLIDSEEGVFRLVADSPVEILVREGGSAPKSQTDHRISLIKEKLVESSFSMTDVATLLNVSRPMATLILKEAVKRGDIKRTGNGKNTRYEIIDPQASTKEAA